MEFVLEEICHRGGSFTIWYYFPLGKFCHGISSGGGGGGGSFAIIWYSFMGNICHMVSFPGGGGTICHGICSLIMKFVWGGFTIWYCFPPGEVLPWDFFRGKVCHMVFFRGERLSYGIISGGGGVVRGGGGIPMWHRQRFAQHFYNIRLQSSQEHVRNCNSHVILSQNLNRSQSRQSASFPTPISKTMCIKHEYSIINVIVIRYCHKFLWMYLYEDIVKSALSLIQVIWCVNRFTQINTSNHCGHIQSSFYENVHFTVEIQMYGSSECK